MSFVSQVKKISIVSIIIAIVMGILFIAFPDKCITYVSLAVGISLILLGVAGIISYIADKSSSFTLALGIVSVIAGIVVCAKYQAIISFIVVFLGLFILICGIFNLFTAIKVIASSFVFGWATLALSLVTSVFGIIAITKSGTLTITIVQFIGVALLVYALLDIISYIQVKKLAKEVKSAIEATSDIETDAVIVEETDDIESEAPTVEEPYVVETDAEIVEETDE